jgi:hypothetical protein
MKCCPERCFLRGLNKWQCHVHMFLPLYFYSFLLKHFQGKYVLLFFLDNPCICNYSVNIIVLVSLDQRSKQCINNFARWELCCVHSDCGHRTVISGYWPLSETALHACMLPLSFPWCVTLKYSQPGFLPVPAAVDCSNDHHG